MKDPAYEIILLNFLVTGLPGHLHTMMFWWPPGLYHLPVKFVRVSLRQG